MHRNIGKTMKIKTTKNLQTSTNTYGKNCYQVSHIQVMIKILKNVTNIIELSSGS